MANPYLEDRYWCRLCSSEFSTYRGAELHVKCVHEKTIYRDPKTGRWTRAQQESTHFVTKEIAAIYIIGVILLGIISYNIGKRW